MIDLDITFFIQLANFFIVLAVLNPLLIKPIRKIIKERKEAAAALLGESEGFFQSAEGKLGQYEAALAEAMSAGDGITAKAAQEAQASLKAARERIDADTAAAFDVLRGEIDPLARQIMDKVTA